MTTTTTTIETLADLIRAKASRETDLTEPLRALLHDTMSFCWQLESSQKQGETLEDAIDHWSNEKRSVQITLHDRQGKSYPFAFMGIPSGEECQIMQEIGQTILRLCNESFVTPSAIAQELQEIFAL